MGQVDGSGVELLIAGGLRQLGLTGKLVVKLAIEKV